MEVLENRPKFQRKEAGHRTGEDVFAAFGRTNIGRFLSIFFVYTRGKRAIIVSVREMTQKERRKYAR
ncbi:MAG TPA: BrnT family toxin [Ignavibacteria bacterium]|nr:BrnT family toxin [Ignavibacteria bacterium]